MSLAVTPIPEHVRAQLAANSDFMLLALNAWRETAAATLDLVQHNVGRMEDAERDAKAFLGWEIVTAAVELAEIVGTVLVHVRDRHASPFHAADNPTLRTLFDDFRTRSLPEEEVRKLLGLRLPPGFGAAAVRAGWVHTKVVQAFQAAVYGIAQFWQAHTNDARWWRHLPMSLTWEESMAVSPMAGSDRDQLLAEIEATPERIETLARMDEQRRSFDHTALLAGQVRAAAGVASVAGQLIINIIANATPTGAPPSGERWLFPFLTRDLTPAERQILEDDANYHVA